MKHGNKKHYENCKANVATATQYNKARAKAKIESKYQQQKQNRSKEGLESWTYELNLMGIGMF